MTTMVLPAFSGSLRQAHRRPPTAAPQEMPDRMPSSRARRRAKSIASSLVTCSISSTSDRSRIVGNEAGADALDLVRPGLQRLAGAASA